MKKVLFLSLMALLIMALAIPANAVADITVFIDGVQIVFDVPPVIVEGRTLVPLRAIFEGLDMTVVYEPTTKMITGTSSEKRVILQVNSTAASVTDFGTGITTSMTLDVPAQIVESRTLVPLRFVGESTGASVVWDGPTRTINITTPSTSEPDPEPENLPPTALADPVQFSIGEQSTLMISVDELAEDTDGLTTDELEIVQVSFDGWTIDYGDFEVAPDGLSLGFMSIDIPAISTQLAVVEVTDGTNTIDVNIEILIMPQMIEIPNLPPVALGDPVEFSVIEQTPLVISVDELAEDNDLWTTDVLTITGHGNDGIGLLTGTYEIAPDGSTITFTSIDIGMITNEYEYIEVSDGTNTIEVNIKIVINPTVIILPNLPPVALADPVEFSTVEGVPLVISVNELAEDTDVWATDILTITGHGNDGIGLLTGSYEIAPDGSTITFTSIDISSPITEYEYIEVSDGTYTIEVNIEIAVSPIAIVFPLNWAPVPLADPVAFSTFEQTALVVSVEELASDLNGDDLTITAVVAPSLFNWGSWEIAPDGETFTFTSINISKAATQTLTATVSDGSLTCDVNVQVSISPSMIVFLNFAPQPKGDPVEISTLDFFAKIIAVDDLATDLNGDDLTITNVAIKKFTISYGTTTIASDGKSITFNPDIVTVPRTHYLVVTVSDGQVTTNVNVAITITHFTMPTPPGIPGL